MNSIKVMARRRLVFMYHELGLNASDMHPLVARVYDCSVETLRRDIRGMHEWLPSLVSMGKGNSDKILALILNRLQIARDRLLKLSFEADNSNAQVGAGKAYLSTVIEEAKLMLEVGALVRVPFRAEFIDRSMSPEELEAFENRAFAAIGKNMLDEEKRQRRQIDLEQSHPGEFSGQERGGNWVGSQEGVPPENGGERPFAPESPYKDTSQNGRRIGGIVKRR